MYLKKSFLIPKFFIKLLTIKVKIFNTSNYSFSYKESILSIKYKL